MRKIVLLVLVAAMFAVTTAPATAKGSEVRYEKAFPCGVEWEGTDIIWDDDCRILNIKHPNGAYTIVLLGQVPDDHLQAFQDSGVRRFPVACWANYLFVAQEPYEEPVISESVRRFTPNGKMLEVCRYMP